MCSKITSHSWSIWECYKQPHILGIIDKIIASIEKKISFNEWMEFYTGDKIQIITPLSNGNYPSSIPIGTNLKLLNPPGCIAFFQDSVQAQKRCINQLPHSEKQYKCFLDYCKNIPYFAVNDFLNAQQFATNEWITLWNYIFPNFSNIHNETNSPSNFLKNLF